MTETISSDSDSPIPRMTIWHSVRADLVAYLARESRTRDVSTGVILDELLEADMRSKPDARPDSKEM
jgi:hypothetical protein